MRRRKKCPQPANIQAIESEPISQVTAIHHLEANTSQRRRKRSCRRHNESAICAASGPTPTRLEHHIFTKGEWRRAQLRDHSRVTITISVDNPANSTDGQVHRNQVTLSLNADTAAQSDLWSIEDFLACGFSRDDLQPVRLSLAAASHSPIRLEGAFFAKLTATLPNGKLTSSHSMVYVSNLVRAMYLSYESLLNLGLLPRAFPSPGGTQSPSETNSLNETHKSPTTNASRFINDGWESPQTSRGSTCSYPQRTTPPLRPTELPFPSIPENNQQMKAWLIERYASSTFNTCPQRALPCMDSPSTEILVDPTATLKALHTQQPYPSTGRRKCTRTSLATKHSVWLNV